LLDSLLQEIIYEISESSISIDKFSEEEN